MSAAHPEDELAAFAAGALAPERHEAVSVHLASCTECASVLAQYRGALSRTVAKLPAPPHVLSRVLQRLSGPERFSAAVPALKALYGFEDAQVEELLQRVLDERAWSPGPAEGIRLLPVTPAPSVRGDAIMVWAAPGATYPHHEHTGDEHVVVVDGAVRDDTGVYAQRGDRVLSKRGTAHSLWTVSDVACICAVLTEPAA
jgi:putative transcriptional regulator